MVYLARFVILGSERSRYVRSMSRRNVLYDENMDTSKMTTAQFRKWQAAAEAEDAQREKIGIYHSVIQTPHLINTRCH